MEQPAYLTIKNLPNILTATRLLTLPLLLWLMFIDNFWAAWGALALYTIGCITDWLDGWLARKMDIESAFGKFLDPIADKIFVMSVILCLVATHKLDGILVIPALVILCRELLISGLREFLGPKNISVPVTQLAKWKTGVQMTALGFLVVGEHGNWLLPITMLVGDIMITIAAILTAITGWAYLKAGLKHLH